MLHVESAFHFLSLGPKRDPGVREQARAVVKLLSLPRTKSESLRWDWTEDWTQESGLIDCHAYLLSIDGSPVVPEF